MSDAGGVIFSIKTNFPRETIHSYKRTFAFETKQNFPDETQKNLYKKGINPLSGKVIK